jgi:hypothetical protein
LATVKTSRGRLAALALGLILVLAAALRFTGLNWRLRQTPELDETDFVENVAKMIVERDLDHRFYEYPGLFFYTLYPFLSLLPKAALTGPGAYLLARRVVASFGVASVGLSFWLGAQRVSVQAGLVAALLLAVSPIEVETAHMIRPDVALGTLALLTLWAVWRVGVSSRGDTIAGLALGAATALKFSGLLLFPSYLLRRVFEPGRRLRGTLIAAVVATTVGVACTPYAILHFREFAAGAYAQWHYHYRGGGPAPRLNEILLYYLRTIFRSLGPTGSLFAVVGLSAARRDLRTWRPVVALPIVMLIVLSTAESRWIRLIVPALGATGLVAALGFESVARRFPRTAWILVLAGALVPVRDAAHYVRAVSRPGTRDRALDWVEAHVPPGGVVFTSMPELAFDSARRELLFPAGSPQQNRLTADGVGALVWEQEAPEWLKGRLPDAVFEPSDPLEGPRVVAYRARDVSSRWRPLSLGGARLSASSNAVDLPAAADGRLETYWKAAEPDTAEEWLDVALPTPVWIGRIELLLGQRPNRAGRRLRVSVSDDGHRWTPIVSAPGRPEVERQVGIEEGEGSQVVLVAPTLTRWVRISAQSPPGKRWGFAELHLDAVDSPEVSEARGR